MNSQPPTTINAGISNVVVNPNDQNPVIVSNMLPTVDDAKIIVANFTNIFARLKVIGTLQGGYKIHINIDPITNVKTFSIDNSYIPSLSRWYFSQNREDIINTIIDDTNYIQSHYNKLNIKARDTLKNVINSALIGIKNMKETYKAVKLHEESLQIVIDTLSKYVSSST